jgi:transcriptional regulator with XRE-family HTH domain
MADSKPTREDRQRRIREVAAGVPAALRAMRGRRVTRARLARYTDIDEATLLRIESTQQPTLEQLLLVCDAFETTPWAMLGGLRSRLPDAEPTEIVAAGSRWLVTEPEIGQDPVVQTLAPGRRETAKRHDGTEWLLPVSGAVGLRLGESPDPVALDLLRPLRFDATDVHGLVNLGDEPAVVVRRFSPTGLRRHAELELADEPLVRNIRDDL